MNETMRGVNALMVNFGLDAQTAMDYIVKGSQNGLDKTQELGDNLSEYAGKFAQAGYSAEEYFQLLQNGLEGLSLIHISLRFLRYFSFQFLS